MEAPIAKSRWAIFFDRDGTLIVDRHYMWKIEEIEFLPAAIKGLLRLQSINPLLFVVTNQAGIARSLFSLEDATRFNDEVNRRLKAEGVTITKTYLCPHHPDFTGPCECRKPVVGLAQSAAEEFDLDLTRSIFIGDKDSDMEFGRRCGGLTIRVQNTDYPATSSADYTVANLVEAAHLLTKQSSL